MSPLLLIAAGGVYAVCFWILAMRSPRWALLLIFATTPFQGDVSGGGPLKFSIAEINLMLCIPVVLLRSRRLLFGPTLLPALILLLICLFSALGQWRETTLQSLLQQGIFTVLLVVVFASLARTEEDYRLAFKGIIVVGVFLACSIFAFRTAYIYNLHKNGVGASLACILVISLELWLTANTAKARLYYLGASGVIALGCLITVSRGAWMSAIVGVMVILGIRGRVGLIVKCALVLLPLLVIGWKFLPDDSRDYATSFGQEHLNIKARYDSIDYGMKLFDENPLQGAGMGLRKDYDATNIVVLCLAETGLPGLIAFLALNAAVVFMVLGARRGTPEGTLAFSILALALGLILGKFVHGLVDHYWSRGSLTAAWATVGMATRVIGDQRRRRQQLAREKEIAAYTQANALAEHSVGAPG